MSLTGWGGFWNGVKRLLFCLIASSKQTDVQQCIFSLGNWPILLVASIPKIEERKTARPKCGAQGAGGVCDISSNFNQIILSRLKRHVSLYMINCIPLYCIVPSLSYGFAFTHHVCILALTSKMWMWLYAQQLDDSCLMTLLVFQVTEMGQPCGKLVMDRANCVERQSFQLRLIWRTHKTVGIWSKFT